METMQINGETWIKLETSGGHTLVRSYAAGVHVGRLVKRDGADVELSDARIIHRWRGARTCHEIALYGIDSAKESGYTRVSEAVPAIVLPGVCQVIPMAADAWDKVTTAGWTK